MSAITLTLSELVPRALAAVFCRRGLCVDGSGLWLRAVLHRPTSSMTPWGAHPISWQYTPWAQRRMPWKPFRAPGRIHHLPVALPVRSYRGWDSRGRTPVWSLHGPSGGPKADPVPVFRQRGQRVPRGNCGRREPVRSEPEPGVH